MLVKSKRIVVLLARSEIEKTPLVVFPHEVEALIALHGEDAVRVTKDQPPKGTEVGEFDTADEYSRLEQYYRGNNENPHPIRDAYGSLRDFEGMFKETGGSNTTGGKSEGSDGMTKAQLIERAEELGIEVNKKWGVPKLTEEIEKAEDALVSGSDDGADGSDDGSNDGSDSGETTED